MAICPQSKPTNTSPLSSKVNFDLSRNVLASYDPKSVTSVKPLNSQAKPTATELANELQTRLPSDSPCFFKLMLPSHVTRCFWLGLPKKFCDTHLPKQDETIVLVDEEKQEFETKYLVRKTGLSGGWRGFAIAHKLLEGDALVFQLIQSLEFRVYIVRVNGVNEIDGALGLLSLVPNGMNVYQQQTKKGLANLQNFEDMDIDLHQENVHEKGLVPFDQSEDNSEYNQDSSASEGLRFSESVIEFKHIKDIKDFNIIVDGLVIDSEIPNHFITKYYDLCHSQKTYLHENLLKGLNVSLIIGIILETITISDAIRACKVTITRDDFETWDKTLRSFEEVGMKVAFLRLRIRKLVGLLFESNEVFERKMREKMKAEEVTRVIDEKDCGLIEVIENLDVEIKNLKSKNLKIEVVFHKEANAPW